jgi:hypothetical protein
MCIRRLTFTGLVALLSAVTALPTEHVVVNLEVTTARQDSPVQIVGFKLPSAVADKAQSESVERAGVPLCRWCPKVLLHNTTAKHVTTIQLQGVMGDPNRSGGDKGGVSGGVAILTESRPDRPSPYVISPNGDAEFGDSVLWPFNLAIAGATLVGSNCLHVAVIVWSVKFSDGTLWVNTYEQEHSSWTDSLRQKGISSCTDLSAVDLKTLHSGTVSFEPPSRQDPGITQSYSATCRVGAIGDKLRLDDCSW